MHSASWKVGSIKLIHADIPRYSLSCLTSSSFPDVNTPGFLTVLKDTKLCCNVDRKVLSFGCALVAWLLSLMYATDAGMVFLDTVDVSADGLCLCFVSWCSQHVPF